MGLRLRFIKGRRIIDIEPFKWPAAATGVVAGMYTLGRMFFRRMSKDNLEVTKDRTEVNIVVGQYERIRELETANKELTAKYVAKVAELGEVKGEVRALSMQTTMQSGQIDMLKATVAAMQEQINQLMMRSSAPGVKT